MNIYQSNNIISSHKSNKRKKYNNDSNDTNNKSMIETKSIDTLPLKLVYENLSTTYKDMKDYIKLYVSCYIFE